MEESIPVICLSDTDEETNSTILWERFKRKQQDILDDFINRTGSKNFFDQYQVSSSSSSSESCSSVSDDEFHEEINEVFMRKSVFDHEEVEESVRGDEDVIMKKILLRESEPDSLIQCEHQTLQENKDPLKDCDESTKKSDAANEEGSRSEVEIDEILRDSTSRTDFQNSPPTTPPLDNISQKSPHSGEQKLVVEKKIYRGNKCSYCGKTVRKLKAHVENVHLRMTKFTCNWCEKRFYFRQALQKHSKVHRKQFGKGNMNKIN